MSVLQNAGTSLATNGRNSSSGGASGNGRTIGNGRTSQPRPKSGRDTRAKLLLTLKYNRATSVLSVVLHKAVNLQVTRSIYPTPICLVRKNTRA